MAAVMAVSRRCTMLDEGEDDANAELRLIGLTPTTGASRVLRTDQETQRQGRRPPSPASDC
jgi:hypothetical protein